MANPHLGEAKSTQRNKVQKVAGNTERYTHPTDKADTYHANEKQDSTTLPTTDKGVGP